MGIILKALKSKFGHQFGIFRAGCAVALLCLAGAPSFGQRSDFAASLLAPSGAVVTLKGVVRLAGDAFVRSTVVENSTDPEICGETHTLEDLEVADGSRGIRHAIVALTDVPPDANGAEAPAREILLDNRACKFIPHAGVLRVGDVIRARNSDSLLHTVHYYGTLKANLALAAQGATRSKKVRRPGMIIVKCDVHGWMQAFFRVDDHPFHAVTDEQGRFEIPGVPPGTYTMEIWHEKLGALERTVRVEPDNGAMIEVEYDLDSR